MARLQPLTYSQEPVKHKVLTNINKNKGDLNDHTKDYHHSSSVKHPSISFNYKGLEHIQHQKILMTL